jgi:hypothetical protein
MAIQIGPWEVNCFQPPHEDWNDASTTKTKYHLKSVSVLNESKTGEKGDDWYLSTPALFGFMTYCIHTHKYLSIYRLSSVPRWPTLWLVILPIESANQQQQTPIAAAAASLWTGWAIGLLHRGALYSIWFDSICIRHRLGRERERDDRISRRSDTTMNRRVPTMHPGAASTHITQPRRSIEIGRRRFLFI